MKQPEGRKKRRKPGQQTSGASADSPAVSYTPEQRRMIRDGMRIWARVAIRSYLRQRGGDPQGGTEPEEEDED